MSLLQETARITIQFTLSTIEGELPNNTELTEALWASLPHAFIDNGLPQVETLSIDIIGRTGELDHPDPAHNDGDDDRT